MNEEFDFNETNVNEVVEVVDDCELVEVTNKSDKAKVVGLAVGVAAAAIGIGAVIVHKCKGKIKAKMAKSLEKDGYTVLEPLYTESVNENDTEKD